jgi:RecA-family ATPase
MPLFRLSGFDLIRVGDDDDVCRRLEAIGAHNGATRRDMGKLHVLSFAGRDAILGYPDRDDGIRRTPLFEQLRREALRIRPRLIVLDTAADVFAGKEIDRAHTRQFITLLRGLAIESGAAVVMAAHPSLSGITSDSGSSGSTAWHNSVRARMCFKSAADVADSELRVLERATLFDGLRRARFAHADPSTRLRRPYIAASQDGGKAPMTRKNSA